jgi:hypothetical protein
VKFKNKYNYHQLLLQAIGDDEYDKGSSDYSVTQLIRPAYQARLLADHADGYSVDVDDKLKAFIGTAVHHYLARKFKRAGHPENMIERRLHYQMNGHKLSGQLDLYFPGTGRLVDHKTTSAWSVINGAKSDWVSQLNLLAYLAHHNDLKVKSLEVWAFLLDWSHARYLRERDYPAAKHQRVEIELWHKDQAKAFLSERIKLHHYASTAESIEVLEPCTKDEMWAVSDKWAVMKKGKKRALKLHMVEQDAINHVDGLDAKHYVEFRPGERKRCSRYCEVAAFCPEYEKFCKGVAK